MEKNKRGINPLAAFFVAILTLGFMAYVFWANFQIPESSPVSEAKSNLGAIYTAQQVYFLENHVYAGHTAGKNCFQLIHWEPAGANRYRYYCDTTVQQ